MTNPAGQVESYTYDSGGEEATRTETDGSVTQYGYNAAGQLTKLTDGSGNLITQHIYNALGRLSGSLDGNGQTTSYRYDADGDVTQILTEGTVTSRRTKNDFQRSGQQLHDQRLEPVHVQQRYVLRLRRGRQSRQHDAKRRDDNLHLQFAEADHHREWAERRFHIRLEDAHDRAGQRARQRRGAKP